MFTHQFLYFSKMDIAAFPNEIFLLIITHLTPKELILCRSVNKRYLAAFKAPKLNRHVLVQHYPPARELRYLDQNVDWAQIFTKVAGQHHHLKAGTPRSISKPDLSRSLDQVLPRWARYYPISGSPLASPSST